MITAIPIDSCFYEERTSHISDLISMETKKKTKCDIIKSRCIYWKNHEVPGRGICSKYKGQIVKSIDCQICPDKKYDDKLL